MNYRCDGLELLLRIRPVDPTTLQNNHFVRLSPQTAQHLLAKALSQFLNNPDSSGQMDEERRCSGWWIDREASGSRQCASGIEFLPLVITFENGETIYASYNGGDLVTTKTIPVSAFDEGAFPCLDRNDVLDVESQ
jgi:hypothetical protein